MTKREHLGSPKCRITVNLDLADVSFARIATYIPICVMHRLTCVMLDCS